MCGVAEAALVMAIASAVTSTMASQTQAKNTQRVQQQRDRVAYHNYLVNTKVLDRQADQIREQSAQKSMSQAVEAKKIEGANRVYFGEVGLGDMAMEGRSSDTYFTDLLFQTATGRARLKGETENNLEQIFMQEEVSYLNYRASNAAFTPTPYKGWGDALMEIGSAATSYGGNSNRKYFKDTSAPMGHNVSQHTSSGQMVDVW